MSQIEQVVKQIQSEFRIDGEGRITVSLRGAARLADIEQSSLSRAFDTDAQRLSQLCQFLVEQGVQADAPKQWLTERIPDTALALILEYYAYECQERYRSQQAKRCCRAFNSIGIRSWVQTSLGWQKPEQPALAIAPEVEVAREVAEIYGSLSTYNPRIAQLLVDSRVNRFMGQAALTGTVEVWKGAVEIAEDLGYKVNHKERGKLGKHVKACVGHLGKEERRLCNGTNRPIMLYPVNEEVKNAVTGFFDKLAA